MLLKPKTVPEFKEGSALIWSACRRSH